MIKHPVDNIDREDSSLKSALASLNIPLDLYVERYKQPVYMKRKDRSSRKKKHAEQKKVRRDKNAGIWKYEYKLWYEKEISNYFKPSAKTYLEDKPPDVLKWMQETQIHKNVSSEETSRILCKLQQLYQNRSQRAESNVIDRPLRSLRNHVLKLIANVDEYSRFAEEIDKIKREESLVYKYGDILGDLIDVQYTAVDLEQDNEVMVLKKVSDLPKDFEANGVAKSN